MENKPSINTVQESTLIPRQDFKNPFLKNFENPFVGLRPFEPTENLLFFGRDKQIAELIEKLRSFHFIAVIGNSGCGKSSLIRAGLIPNLKKGFLEQQYDSWNIAIMRPSNDPLYNLADSLLKTDLLNSQSVDDTQRHKNVMGLKQEIIGGGAKLVYEKIKEISSSNDDKRNFFLLIDQFEELFDDEIKYKPDKDNKVTDAYTVKDNQLNFVNILLDLAKQGQLPIYIVITMRSDFLGHCNQFFGLPEIMNQGQYLVPRLDREQRRSAIEGPIYLFKAKINNVLLNRLLVDSDSSEDELPVLQHALMRTWVTWKKQTAADKDESNKEIDLSHYEDAGGMGKALSIHANEIYNNLFVDAKNDTTNKEILEKNQKVAIIIFKSLIKIDEKGRRVRRPQEFQELDKLCASLVQSTSKNVEFVINAFRKEGNAFLSPYKGGLFADTEIDISHESLIRKWDKLNDVNNYKGWITEEYDAARTYIWLADAVRENRAKLQKFDIKTVKEWEKNNFTSNEWAKRYGGNYEEVLDYIADSKRKVNNRRLAYGLIIGLFAFLIFVILTAIANNQKNIAIAESERNKAIAESERNIAIAESERNKAIAESERNKAIAESAEKNIAIASNAKNIAIAENAKNIAIAENAKNIAIAEKANAENDSIKSEIAKNDLIDAHLEKRKDSLRNITLETQIALNEIYKTQFFYRSNSISDSDKASIISAIFYKTLDTAKIPLEKYVDTSLLTNINLAVKAKNDVLKNPIAAVNAAKVVWSNQKNSKPIIKHLLSTIFNEFIFCLSSLGFSNTSGFAQDATFANNSSNNFAINFKSNWFNRFSFLRQVNYINDNFYLNNKIDTFKNKSTIISLVFSGDSLVMLKENGQIIEKGPKGDYYTVGEIKDFNYSRAYSFSSNGQFFINIDLKGQVVLWKLHPFSRIVTNVKIEKSEMGRKISLSDNGKFVLIEKDDGSDIFNLFNNSFKKNKILPTGHTSFISGKDYLINYNSLGIQIYDFDGNPISDIQQIALPQDAIFKSLNVSISPDWKRMILKNDQNLFLFETNEHDSIFRIVNNGAKILNDLKVKRFAGLDSNGMVLAKFINNNTIVTLDKNKFLQLWRVNPFKDLNTSFKETKIGQSYNEYVLKYEIANYKQQAINNELLLKSQNNDTILKRSLSMIYWRLSWRQVLVKDYNEAINSANRGLELYSKNTGIVTNLALAYLLSNQFSKAENLYIQYKNLSYFDYSISVKFINAFNDDIKTVINSKIASATDENIVKVLKLLNGN